MKKNRLVVFLSAFVLALGTITFSSVLSQNFDFAINDAYVTPMRIDLSYENEQLTKEPHDVGDYYYVRNNIES